MKKVLTVRFIFRRDINIFKSTGDVVQKPVARQNFIARWSVRGIYLQQTLYHVLEVLAEMLTDWVVGAPDDLLAEALHTVGSEWWEKHDHLVEDASQAPDVALVVVWLVSPDLGTGVVWGTSLCAKEASLGYL